MRTPTTLTILLLLTALVAAAFAAEGNAVPRIYLPEAKFEFGKVKAGETVEHIFEVRNAGGGVLQINRVQSS